MRAALAITLTSMALVGAGSTASAATVSPANSGSGAATGSTALGSYEISSARIDIDGSGLCFDLPMDLDITTSLPEVYWSIKWGVGPVGSVPTGFGADDGQGSASRAVSYQYCPNAFRPTNVVTCTIEFTYYPDDGMQKVESTFRFEVAAMRAATQTIITKVARDQFGVVQVAGKVTTTSGEYGRVGASGLVHLFVQGPGKRWTKVGEGYISNSVGDVQVVSTKVTKKRATYRLDFVGNDWSAPSQSKPKAG